jgi:hypothetical protein
MKRQSYFVGYGQVPDKRTCYVAQKALCLAGSFAFLGKPSRKNAFVYQDNSLLEVLLSGI